MKKAGYHHRVKWPPGWASIAREFSDFMGCGDSDDICVAGIAYMVSMQVGPHEGLIHRDTRIPKSRLALVGDNFRRNNIWSKARDMRVYWPAKDDDEETVVLALVAMTGAGILECRDQ